jgi:beta-N-acetylhexosaminidase
MKPLKALKLYLVYAICLLWEQLAFAHSDGWIDGKLKTLSLEEKIGQMMMVNLSGQAIDSKVAESIDRCFFGSVILFEHNIDSRAQLSMFIKQLQDRSQMRSGVPLIFAVDQEGGLVNRIGRLIDPRRSQYSPRVIGQAFAFKQQSTQRALRTFYRQLAAEMKSWGINMNLAPVLDLSNDPKSAIYPRSYGNNPHVVGAIAFDMAQAMQSHGVVVTGKHFPNLSNSTIDSHIGLPVLQRTVAQLKNHEFKPYYELKNALDAVMLGHILVPSIDAKLPASLSHKTTRILRKEIGFDGVIITDDLKMGALSKNFTPYEIVMNILAADVDMLLVASEKNLHQEIFDLMVKAVKSRRISIKRIDESVSRILQMKRRYLYEKHDTKTPETTYARVEDWMSF